MRHESRTREIARAEEEGLTAQVCARQAALSTDLQPDLNKTVSSLLRRVMNKARDAWNVTILKEINWEAHFLDERKRPVREITLAEDARLDGVESKEYAILREFAEIMGLRRKELLLTWPQVDFENATIAIIGKGGVPAILPLPGAPTKSSGRCVDTTKCRSSPSSRNVPVAVLKPEQSSSKASATP